MHYQSTHTWSLYERNASRDKHWFGKITDVNKITRNQWLNKLNQRKKNYYLLLFLEDYEATNFMYRYLTNINWRENNFFYYPIFNFSWQIILRF